MPVCCFLPCRKGSERVPRKNIKPFADIPHGLIELKLKQLLATSSIDEIVLSTNDDEILSYGAELRESRIRLHERSEMLSSSETSTDDLVHHAVELIPEADILWTHVTAPFVNSAVYEAIIAAYQAAIESGYDSLMTTTHVQTFLWNEAGPVNYDRAVEKWPRTQTLPRLHEVNSCAFLSHSRNYREYKDRIGKNPMLFSLGKIDGFDIDWPDDFALAEQILHTGLAKI